MNRLLLLLAMLGFLLPACQNESTTDQATEPTALDLENFVWSPESFADKRIIRYVVPDFDKLTLNQKKLAYYLTMAGLAGRDITYDANYRHNLTIRRALENIVENYQGDRNTDDWSKFMLYTKNVWFSNGIHHHYGNDKFIPEFSQDYFQSLMDATQTKLPAEALQAMFDPNFDAKKIVFDASQDMVKGSAVNFYDPDITQAEVEAFYANLIKDAEEERVSYGINSKLVRLPDGSVGEKVWHADGMYGEAIREIIKWLELARDVAENEAQGKAIEILANYYRTGDLKLWDTYNVAWVRATEGDIDYINGFVEVYQDPMGYKGSYENIVQIKDFDASARMKLVAENAQYFESNSPIMEQHKKEDVVGISYNVVSVVGEAGDASPTTPIGVNLPNADWIRAKFGSKSVSLGNIIEAYNNADGPGMLQEFAHDQEEIERAQAHGQLAAKIHTALHEVIGHASGQLEPGVSSPADALKSYFSPLEEARADLVALYYIMDPKLVELGLMESLEVGKASYDAYIRNGLMLQLRRIELGKNIEQAHMRNRQSVAAWVFEKGQAENVISQVTRDGNVYFKINDYDKLRGLFGELLREVQRIKSQGDFKAGRDFIENYGVKVDRKIHEEVLRRSEKLNIPPYGGFINPRLVPVTDAKGNITDIRVEYPDDFTEQMLEYAKMHSFLPNVN
jgi:dipeptidyl-peptidase-3